MSAAQGTLTRCSSVTGLNRSFSTQKTKYARSTKPGGQWGFIPVTPCSLGKRQPESRKEPDGSDPLRLPFRFAVEAPPHASCGRPRRRAQLNGIRAECYGAAHENPSAVRALRARPVSALAVLIVLARCRSCCCSSVVAGSRSKRTPSKRAQPRHRDASAEQPTPPAERWRRDLGRAGLSSQSCALCHGTEGKGDGPASAGLNPKPRNHTDGSYMNAQTDDAAAGGDPQRQGCDAGVGERAERGGDPGGAQARPHAGRSRRIRELTLTALVAAWLCVRWRSSIGRASHL